MFAYLQNKLYPREVDRNARGRIRVQLRNDDGTPVLPQFPSRQYFVLLFVCVEQDDWNAHEASLVTATADLHVF